MAATPTIVAASLDSKDLEKSINDLVSKVNEGTKQMADNFTTQVERMQSALKNLGATKVEFGSGGKANPVELQKELEAQAKKTTQATKEQTMTYDQMSAAVQRAVESTKGEGLKKFFDRNELQSYIELLRNLQAEYIKVNTTEGGGAKSDRIKAEMQALEQIIAKYQDILKNLDYVNSRQGTIDIRKWIQDLTAVDDRYSKLTRWYSVLEKEDQRRIDNEAKANKKRLEDLEKEQRARDKMVDSARKAEEKYQNGVLKDAWRNALTLPVESIEQAKTKIAEIERLKNTLRSIDIIKDADVNRADALIARLRKQYNIQRDNANTQQGTWTNIGGYRVNQTKEGLNELNAAVERNRRNAIRAEEDKRAQIILTGLTAQQTARTIAESMSAQIDKGGQITQLKELEEAWRQMMQALQNMTQEQLRSPLGDMMLETVAKTELAIAAVKKYNEEIKNTATQQQSKNVGSSYSELSETLKSLTATYHNYNSEQRNNATLGIAVADRIHRINQELRDIQRQMNRPTSLKKALGMDESTLDHISDKIQALRSYRSGLKLTDPKSVEEMRQVDAEINRLTKDMDKYMGRGQQMVETNTALGRSWNYMKNRLAFYFTVGASTSFVKNLIEVRSQYEMNERALGVLINSAERGTQIFNELSQMALVSPYTLIELSSAAKQLVAYDVAAKDVVDTTRRLADMASAVGVPMERLTYALGQIKAYGYLNSRDARMFANAGIPLVKQLSDYYTELEGKLVSTADVYDRIKKKSIEYNDVMQVIMKMTDEGGKFFDFQAKMAETLKVQLANLTLAWNNMLNDIGSQSQGVLNTAIGSLKTIFLHWKQISSAIENIIAAFGLYKLAMIPILAYTQKVGVGLAAMEVAGKRLTNIFYGVGGAFKSLFANWQMMLGMFAAYVAYDMYNTWDKNREAIREFNNAVAKGAEESAKSIDEFLKTEAIAEAKLSAVQGKLSPVDAEKTWEALREEIEKSSIASASLIPILLDITNINERVSEAFTMAEDLRDVENVLSGLKNELKMNQDTILGGLFGEGLAEDLKDYTNQLEYVDERTEHILKKDQGFWEGLGNGIRKVGNDISEAMGSSITEAENETKAFAKDAADTVAELLGKEGVNNATKLAEAVARVKKEAIAATGARGYGRTLLELSLDKEFADRFAKYDRSTTITRNFLEQLKKDYGSAFGNITTDILDKNNKWNKAQIDAFKNTYSKLKTQIPEDWADILDNMVKDLNSRDWTVKVMATFDVTELSDIQKEFRDKFINATDPKLLETEQRRFGKLMRKDGEDNVKYEERIKKLKEEQQKIIQTNAAIIAKSGKNETAVSKEATKAKQDAEQMLQDIEAVRSWGGYDFTSKIDTKARKAAESELQKALKDEIQLIDKVRSQYKKLADAGVSRSIALKTVTEQFGSSINHINAVLGKNGMPLFNIKTFAGTDNPHAMMVMLKNQLDAASKVKNIKPEETKALEVKYSEVKVDAEVYNTTKITKGLNNELDKLKDEYELAIELDANPELGGMFADMFGLDLETLPKNAQEYAEQYTKFLNKYLKEKGSDLSLPNLLNLTSWDMNAFREQMEKGDMNKEWYDVILKGYLATREARKKETAATIKDYEKLLEKYAEYEYKVSQIQKNAEHERETARKNGASKEILDAIDNRERQELAKVAFEEFQKSPEWVVATGDLAGMTDKAIGGLIRKIEDYKKKAKDLDPKQIKQINRALTSLYKQQRQGNPFKAISNAMLEAKNRAAEFNPAIKAAEKELNELENGKRDQDRLAETADKIGKLKARIKELKDEQKEAGKVSASTLVDGINAAIQVAQQATSVFTEMMSALGKGDSVKDVERLFSIIDKAGQSAAIGAQIGGGWGAAIGGVIGGVSGIISSFADEWSGNADITRDVKRSERAVRQLELAFIDLQQAIERAYGTATIGANKLALANKELQLEELKRQLQLEQSRKEKNRDEDRILDLKTQIKELTYEIRNGYTEIVDDLMGTDVGSFAENLVSSMISAFKQGEDYMKVFEEKFDEMVDNMIMKSIVSRVVSQYLDAVWERLENRISSRAKGEAAAYSEAQSKLSEAESMTDTELLHKLQSLASYDWADDVLSGDRGEDVRQYWQKYVDDYRKAVKDEEQAAKERYDAVKAFSDSDVDYIMKEVTEIMPELGEKLKSILGEYYKFGEASDKNLSALQQGIQGITEDTAGALEGMLNGMSQQVYLQSDLMVQIRDAVVAIDSDATLGVMSQMLLQLQSSYQVQSAIQSTLEGWSNPSGQAVRVEMI